MASASPQAATRIADHGMDTAPWNQQTTEIFLGITKRTFDVSKIAIIVPMYNAAETVGAATVQSVLAPDPRPTAKYIWPTTDTDDATVAVAAAAAGRQCRS